MKRVLAFLAVCLIGSPLVAAEPQPLPSQYENLKAFDKLIGTWVYDGPVLEDGPLAKKGDRITAVNRFHWILNKSVVEVEVEVRLPDGRQVSGKGMWGLDPATKRIIGGFMDSLGGHLRRSMTISDEGKTFTSDDKGVAPDGKQTSHEMVMTVEGEKLTVQFKNRQGPDYTGDSPKFAFKRQTK